MKGGGEERGREEGRGERWGERGRGTAVPVGDVEQARVEEERYLGGGFGGLGPANSQT